jgi:hypothetical protein
MKILHKTCSNMNQGLSVDIALECILNRILAPSFLVLHFGLAERKRHTTWKKPRTLGSRSEGFVGLGSEHLDTVAISPPGPSD